ncbi:MAG: hypothetical protein J5I90_16875 [Caldilineales bacterium]|nr:hypothetical protein [Caldilineales bacterium]
MSTFESVLKQTIVSGRAMLYRLAANDGVIMRQTGVMNDPDGEQYFFSSEHFMRALRYTSQVSGHRRLLAQSFITDEFLAYDGPKLFFNKEPALGPYRTVETQERLRDTRLQPYIFGFDDPDPPRRMYFPVVKRTFAPIVSHLQRQIHQSRSNLCCILNRFERQEGMELLNQRIRFVRAFVPHIDIYGKSPAEYNPGWTEFATYKGWAADKFKIVESYTFCLCFENSDSDGYISEKLPEAIMAGAVPLYWGGGDFLADTIPADCYIDCRDLEPESALERILTMPFEEIVAYRQAGIAFLQSEAALRFTRDDWAQRILHRFQEQEIA